MSIVNFKEKIKSFYRDKLCGYLCILKDGSINKDIFVVLLIILTALASFGLGKISAKEKDKNTIKIVKAESKLIFDNKVGDSNIPDTSKEGDVNGTGMLVASKNGAKYYFPWCSGANRIKEENKVWFSSYEEARAVGLTPASGCQGLK